MSAYRLIVQPEAEEDMLAARQWYEGQREGLGKRFIAAIDDALGQIARIPLTFPIAYKECRQYIVRRFPYVIYYLVGDDQVSVIGVFHGRRDPQAWQQRIDELTP
ncbi:MAG: type II toxin-antitoxin system RelE/ParE family toxin [Planctomycetaceae bacterium]